MIYANNQSIANNQVKLNQINGNSIIDYLIQAKVYHRTLSRIQIVVKVKRRIERQRDILTKTFLDPPVIRAVESIIG